MFESMRQDVNDKLRQGATKGDIYAQQGQQIGNILQETGKVINQGMNVLAQNKWNSMKYDLQQEALSGINNETLDVDNENASQDYNKWVSNLVDSRISEGGALVKAYAKDQKQALIDSCRSEFDKQFIVKIDQRNQALFKENEDKIIELWNTKRDLSLFDTNEVFRLSFKNGMVSREKVDLEKIYDEDDTRRGDFNHLLNVLYQNACRVTDTDSAKQYIQDNIDSIEQKCIATDIAQIATTIIEDPSMTQSKIISSIAKTYAAGNERPYTGKEITADEEFTYKQMVESYVQKAWEDKTNQMVDVYNNQVLPTLSAVEEAGSYITSDLFDEVLQEAGVDKRFISTILAKWDSTLQINDAMWGLEDWFENGNPKNQALTSIQNNYVFQDVDSGEWVYTNSAGYILMSGFVDKSVQSARNLAVNAKNIEAGEQMLNNYFDTMTAYTDFRLGKADADNPFEREFNSRKGDKELTPEEEVKLKSDIEWQFLSAAYTNYWKGKSLGADSSEIDSKLSAYRSVYTESEEEQERIREAEKQAKYEQEGIDLAVEDSQLDSEAIYIEDSNIGYFKTDKYTRGANIVVDKAINAILSDEKNAGIAFEDVLGTFSKDPLAVGLTDEEVNDVEEYAAENNVPYVIALLESGKYDGQRHYDLSYQVLETLIAAEGSSDSVQTRLLNTRQDWLLDYASRCDDYENRLGVHNGTVIEGKDDEGNTVYIPSKSSSTKSSSSSSSNNYYSGAKGRLENARTAIKEATEYNTSPQTEIPGVMEGLLSLFGKKDETGHTVTLSDIRMIADPMILTKDQMDAINKIAVSDLGNLLFESNRFNKILDVIDKDSYSERKKEQYLLSMIDFFDRNNANEKNIDKLVDDFMDIVSNASTRDLMNDITRTDTSVSRLFAADDKDLNTNLLGMIKGYGAARVSGENTHASLLGFDDMVDRAINEGLSASFDDLMPESFIALWASDDVTEIWADEDKVMRACLEGAFFLTGNSSMFNSDTEIKTALAEWKTMFDENGEFKYGSSNASDMADTLWENFNVAGQLYSVASAMIRLNDRALNLGTVEAIDGNTFYMSSGVKVNMSVRPSGKYAFNVVSTDGSQYIPVDEFFSESMLEGYSRDISVKLNDSEEFTRTAWIASGNEFTEGANNVGSTNKETMDLAYLHLFTLGYEYSNNIDFSDMPKIVDGQVNMEWADLFGYKAPEVRSGWSMNGYTYNYRLTTDPDMTFNSEPPKKNSVPEAVWEIYKGVNRNTPVALPVEFNGIDISGLLTFSGV